MWRHILKANIYPIHSFWGLISGYDVGDKLIHFLRVITSLTNSFIPFIFGVIMSLGERVGGWYEKRWRKGGRRQLISIPRPHCIPKHKDPPSSFQIISLIFIFKSSKRNTAKLILLQKMIKGWKMVWRWTDTKIINSIDRYCPFCCKYCQL